MALKGDLSNLNLGDLFQTLNQNQQTGTLKIWNRHETREIYFSPNGVTLLGTGGRVAHRLGERFLNAGRLTLEDLAGSLRVAEKRRKPLGSILVERNLVSGVDVERALAEQIEDEIYSLFTWTEGSFEFVQGERELEEGVFEEFTPSFFDVGAVLLEAARRIDEWGEIHRRIEDLNEVFVRSKMSDFIEERLDEGERFVFHAIDGRSDVRTVADTCERPIFEIAKIIHGFLEAGYVREATVDELLEGATEHERSGRKDRVRSILRLVIQRRQVSDPRILRRVADAFVELEDFDAAADIFTEAAHFLQEADRHDEALELLRGAAALAKRHLGSRLLLLRTERQIATNLGPDHALLVVEILEILIEQKRKPDAAPFCEDLAELPLGHGELLTRAANATLLAGHTETAVELLERAGGEAAAEGELQRAVELYREILRISPEQKKIAADLKELLTTAAARRRRKFLVAGVVGIALLGAWFTWQRIDSHRRSQELLTQLERLDQGGDFASALRLAAQIRTEHGGTVAAEKATEMHERLARIEAERKRRERERLAQENHDRMIEAGKLIESGKIDEAFDRYRLVLKGSDAKQHTATIRFRLQTMLSDANVAMKELEYFLRQLPRPLERMETAAIQRGLERLEGLLGHLQPTEVARLRETFEDPAFAKLLDKQLQLPDAAWIERVTEVTARGLVAKQDLQATLANHRERDELDEVYRAARTAEENANFASALTLYEHLAERRSGDGAALFAQKAEHLRGLVRGLERIEQAKQERNFEEAIQILEMLNGAYPEVDLAQRVQLPFLLRSIPPDAEVHGASGLLGTTPLALDYRPTDEVSLEVRRAGFAPSRYVLRGRDHAEATVVLQPVPRAAHRSAGAIEAEPARGAAWLFLADRSGHVSAIDPRDGTLGWSLPVVQSINGLMGAPVAHGPHVFVMSFEGELYRGLATGSGFEIVQRIGEGRFVGPVAGNGKLFAGRGTELFTIDLGDPSTVARTELPTAVQKLLVTGDGLYVVLQDGRLVRFDHATQTESWRRPGTGVATHVLEKDGLALCFGSDGSAVARDATSGRERWRVTLPTASTRRPVWYGDRVLVPIGREVLALHLEDGRALERWPCRAPSADPAVRGDQVLLPTDDELMVHDRTSGKVLWRFRTEGRILAAPHVVGDHVLVTTDRGNIAFLAFP